MFDNLVESTKRKPRRRAGRCFVATCSIYLAALISVGILEAGRLTPVLADRMDLLAKLTPPIPTLGIPEPVRKSQNTARMQPTDRAFATPLKPVPIPTLEALRDLPPQFNGGVVGAPPGIGTDRSGVIGSPNEERAPIPPPPPTPAPKLQPTPAPEVNQGPNKVSEGVLQGKAIRKQIPPYPAMARQVRASGTVQVLVTISEEGQVIEATAVNGHPLLRGVAEAAARQWLFSPTFLSRMPVKVQGVLTFNFKLE